MLPILHTLCIVGALYAFSGEEGGGEGTALPATREETTSERKMRFQEVHTLTPEKMGASLVQHPLVSPLSFF